MGKPAYLRTAWPRLDWLGTVCLGFIVAVILIGVFAPWIAPHDPTLVAFPNKFKPMSSMYWLGTDQLGRCIFSRLIYGIRSTVFMALGAMLITLMLGTLAGLIAGYFGGRVDAFMMRLCDVLLSFPGEIMILTIVGVLGGSALNIIGAIAIVKWPWYARIIRASVLRYAHSNYVIFAKVHQASVLYIMRRHLLPSVIAEVIALATINIGSVILMISALSFLGLGIQAPTPEWGMMLSEAKNLLTTRPYLMLAPGLAITSLVIAFNYLGDALQDRLDKNYQSQKKV